MTRFGRHGRAGSVAVAIAIAAAGCSDTGNGSTPTTIAPTSAPTTTTAPDDGVLRIGVLLPLSGPGAVIGEPMNDAIALAVDEINEGGGVAGSDVELVVADEGDGPVSAARGVEELLDSDVDAVIGPASSVVALDVLVTLRRERLLTCSPSATGVALDEFPDEGLFFRTVPSDSLQAGAIARAIDLTGRSSVAITYVDDAYGSALTDRLTAQLAGRAVTVEELVPFRVDDADLRDEVERVAESGAQVIALIGDPAAGPRMVSALLEGTDAAVPIIVNDALRGAPAANVLRELSGGAIARLRGVGLHVKSDNVQFVEAFEARFPQSSGLLASNALECADLIALAAWSAASTSSPDMAAAMARVSAGGQPCTTFAACVEALEAGRNIDYDGPSGALQLTPAGEVERGTYDLFGFDVDGRERALNVLTISINEPTPTL
jgi:branched-chain amino acid transport system substrate-binding protein